MPLSQWAGDDGSGKVVEIKHSPQPSRQQLHGCSPIKGEGTDLSS